MAKPIIGTQAIDALMPKCRTFSADGSELLCDRPGRYLMWGHLFNKMDKGPKCQYHLPREVRDFRPGLGTAPVFDLREFAKQVLRLLPEYRTEASIAGAAIRDAANLVAEKMGEEGGFEAEGILLIYADEIDGWNRNVDH